MKMRKLLALLLALVMVFALGACGSSAETVEEKPAEEKPVSKPVEEPAPADGEADWAAIAAEIEPLTITYNATVNENELVGDILKYFESSLAELSDGKITLNIYWGGTVYDDLTQFDALRNGAVDMISVNPMQHGEYIYFLNFGQYGIGTSEDIINLWETMLFEDEETAAILQGQAAENNMYYLNVLYNGSDALVSTYEWDTLDEMIAKCKCMGSGDNAKFDIMGLNSVFVVPSETYDALQRGICDTANCALAAVYAMSWDEVAPNVMLNGLIAAGSCYTINLDFWNKLSQGQQQIIREAALRTGSYSVEVQNSQEDTMISTIEERSNKKIKRLSEEDVLKYYGYQFESNAANCLNRVAGDAEKTANMTKLLQKTADYYGYDWTPPES